MKGRVLAVDPGEKRINDRSRTDQDSLSPDLGPFGMPGRSEEHESRDDEEHEERSEDHLGESRQCKKQPGQECVLRSGPAQGPQ